MLPLLPALFLLILQGPSSIEMMASDGRLPAALEAVSRRLEAQDHRAASLEKADAAVLASLLAIGNDSEFSNALFRLLTLECCPEPTDSRLGDPEPVEPACFQDGQYHLSDAFSTCQRTRDGPR